MDGRDLVAVEALFASQALSLSMQATANPRVRANISNAELCSIYLEDPLVLFLFLVRHTIG